MRKLATAIIFTGVFCAAAPAQSRLTALPPDSGLVLGIEWRRMIHSPVGASMVEQIEKSPFAQIPVFKNFQDILLNNVDSITISIPTSGLTPGVDQPPALMIVKGRFETARLRSLIAKKGQVGEKYNAVELLVPPDSAPKSKPGTTRIALLDNNTIIAGDRAQVRAAIDRIKKGDPAQGRPEILAGAAELSRNDLWMILNIPPGLAKDAPPAMAQMLAGVNSSELGVSFGEGIAIEMNFRTADDATAQSLARGVQGLVTLAALNQDESSKSAMETLKKIQITPEGPLVRLELALDKEEFEKVIRERQTPRPPTAISGIATPPSIAAPPNQPAATAPPARKMIRISGLDSGPVEIPLAK